MKRRKIDDIVATATGQEQAAIMADAFTHVDVIKAYQDHSLMAQAIEDAFRRFAERRHALSSGETVDAEMRVLQAKAPAGPAHGEESSDPSARS